MAFGSRIDIDEQFAEGLREIRELQSADGQAMRDLIDVRLVDIFAIELFAQVVDPEGHDRESVDRAAGGFGIESSVGRERGVLLLQVFRDPVVDPFDPVVALLIVLVDRSFDASDIRVRDIGGARNVFFVP